MVLHFIRIIVIIIILLFFIFLPFMPGDYDASAITLSSMAQLLGITGLLFVPVGIAWLIYEIIKQRKKNSRPTNISYRFAMTAFITSVPVALITSLGAFVNYNLFLSIISLAAYAWFIPIIFRKLRQLKNSDGRNLNPTPYYLICVPIIVVLIRFIFIVPAIEYSRSRAIKQSEKFIQDIEAYYTRTGHYPTSLLSLWNDYRPSVKGIEKFHYEIYGNAYNVYFEQFSNELGVIEIVMYNKLDEHEMTSHDTDLLVLSPEEQDRQRGYLAVYDLSQEHWKYFWFD